tara:strand:- start:14 stop:307 length:294 start_codon:yes stop_codon:yes gene_type:complete
MHLYENINSDVSTSDLEVTVDGTVTIYKVAQRGLKFVQNPTRDTIYASYQYGNVQNDPPVFIEAYATRADIPCDDLGEEYSNSDVATWMANNGKKPL